MPGKGTVDAVFILRWIQEKYLAKQKKLHMCFVDLEKTFNRVQMKVVEWAMRKKGIPEALVTAVLNRYKGARTKVKVGTHSSEEFEVIVRVHRISNISPLLFANVVDVVTNEIKESMPQEILYADDIVLIAESMVELQKNSWLEKCT